MRRNNVCPYYIREKRASGTRKGGLYCELARYNFESPKLRRAVLYGQCLNGGKDCSNKRLLDEYYRELEEEENKSRCKPAAKQAPER